MSAIVLILLAIVIFVVAYNTYGKYLAKAWGLSSQNETPAHTMEDGVDYVPAKTPILLGHHFSSIAGAGPINGPIQAALFGWVPVFLWIVIGGIFFGAVQDFGSIFVSIRHQGKSLGEVIEENIGHRCKVLFTVFAWLVLLLVIAAFADIVAASFTCGEGVTGIFPGYCQWFRSHGIHPFHSAGNYFRRPGLQKECAADCFHHCRRGSACYLHRNRPCMPD